MPARERVLDARDSLVDELFTSRFRGFLRRCYFCDNEYRLFDDRSRKHIYGIEDIVGSALAAVDLPGAQDLPRFNVDHT